MNITRNNYEIYAIDYLDGNLSNKLTAELLYFLELNNDLKEELEELEFIKIKPENLIFDKKDLLKEIPENDFFDITEFEYLSTEKIEGNITDKDKKKLSEILLNNPEKKEEYAKFEACKLKPDLDIKYPNKNRIKKYLIRNIAIKSLSLVASIIFLIFTISIIYNYNKPVTGKYITAHKTQNSLKKILTTKYHTKNNDIKQKFHKQSIKNSKDKVSMNEKKKSLLQNIVNNDELIVEIPKTKQGVFLSNNKNNDIVLPDELINLKQESSLVNNIDNSKYDSEEDKNKKVKKYWVISEKAIDIWNEMTSGELIMNNIYCIRTGKIENLELSSNKFKIKKTFKTK